MGQPTFQLLLDDVNNGGTFPYDITAFVRLVDGIPVTRGRGDEFSDIQPSTFAATLENTDGRFTLGSTVGGYGAINIDRQIRYKLTANAATTTRFTGFVQTWPVEWPDGGDTFAVAQITATDEFARLARKTLRSVIEEEYLLDSPQAYYTLGEAAGATQAGDTSGNTTWGPLGVRSGPSAGLVFGTATGPGTDSLTAASFAGATLLGTKKNVTALWGAYTAECFVSTTATVGGTSGFMFFEDNMVGMDSSGRAVIVGATTLAGPVINDGGVHHIAWSFTPSVVSFYVDGALVGTLSTFGSVLLSSASVGSIGFAANISHFAFYSSQLSAARIAAHATAGLNGFAGESSDSRISRLATYGGIPVAAQSLEAGINTSVPFVDITGASAQAEIQQVDAAEGGTVFIRGDGNLVMQNRQHRSLQIAPDLTMTNNEVDPASQVVGDMQLVENDVTTSAGANGAVQVVKSATSIATHGDYPGDLTGLLVGTDELALNAAQWRVAKYAEPFKRMPDLAFDLATLTSAQQAAVMAVEISDRIQITGMPAQAITTTLDLLVEGWTETLGSDSWTWQANTSNFSTEAAWVLDSATYSVLGSTTVLSY